MYLVLTRPFQKPEVMELDPSLIYFTNGPTGHALSTANQVDELSSLRLPQG